MITLEAKVYPPRARGEVCAMESENKNTRMELSYSAPEYCFTFLLANTLQSHTTRSNFSDNYITGTKCTLFENHLNMCKSQNTCVL